MSVGKCTAPVVDVGLTQMNDALVRQRFAGRVTPSGQHLDGAVEPCPLALRDAFHGGRVALEACGHERDVGRAREAVGAGEALHAACEQFRGRPRADDVGEHAAGLDARELIAIAEQDQTRIGAHGLEQAAHLRQVHHRDLVDHDHVGRQGVALVMAGRAIGPDAEKAVQRARLEVPERGPDARVDPRAGASRCRRSPRGSPRACGPRPYRSGRPAR